LRAGILAVGLPLISAQSSAAETFPDRQVTLIIPWEPGGGVDTVARVVQPSLQEALGVPVVIENKGGASGTVGTTYLAKAKPDGYTVMLTTNGPITTAPHSGQNLSYDPLKDVVPVTLITSSNQALVVRTDFPANNLQEFLEVVKANPGKYFYGSSGLGGISNIAMEAFKLRAGLDITHIPFKGSGGILPALLQNSVQITMQTIVGAIPVAENGQGRILAVSSLERNPAAPDVPTFDESGLSGFQSGNYTGFYVPAGTPDSIIAKLHEAFVKVANDPAVKDKLSGDGSIVQVLGQEEFAKKLAADFEENKEIMSKLK